MTHALTLRAAALAAVAAWPLPATAQGTPAAPASAESCQGEWGVLVALSGLGDVVEGGVSAEDGWCVARDVVLGDPDGSPVVQAIEALRWRVEGLDRLADGTGLPHAVEVEVEGFRQRPTTGSPVFDWALGVQGERGGIDARLAARWDQAAREVRVEEASADLPGGRIAVEGRVAGVDLSSLAALQTSAGSAALFAAEVEARLDGAFEALFLMPLATALLDDAPDADPEAQVAALKAQAQAAVAGMPDALMDAASREAASAFVAGLPRPRGTLSLGLSTQAGGGLGVARLSRFALTGAPRTPEDLWPALDGLRLSAGWAPLPAEE